MPIYSIYAKIIRQGKRKRHKIQNTAVHTIYEAPIDYFDLKTILLDAARKIHYDYQQETADVSMQRHLPGRYIRGTTSYRESRIRFRRQDEFRARITYLKALDEVKIEKATFITPEFYNFKVDYDLERHKKWVLPKVVPAGFEAKLNNPDPTLLFTENLNMKTLNYMVEPKNRYGSMQQRRKETGSYAATARGAYAPRNWQTVEQDQQEKENQV
jgi:hypothetical protein